MPYPYPEQRVPYGVPESIETYQGTPMSVAPVVSTELPPASQPVVRERVVANPYYNPAGAAAAQAAGGPPPTMQQISPYATAGWNYNTNPYPGVVFGNGLGAPQMLVGYPSAYPHVLNGQLVDTAFPYLQSVLAMRGFLGEGARRQAALRAGGQAASRAGGLPRAAASASTTGTKPAFVGPPRPGLTGAERARDNMGPYYTQSERDALLRELSTATGGPTPPTGTPPANSAALAPAAETILDPSAIAEAQEWVDSITPPISVPASPAEAPLLDPTAIEEAEEWLDSITPSSSAAPRGTAQTLSEAAPGRNTLLLTALLGALGRRYGLIPKPASSLQEAVQQSIQNALLGGLPWGAPLRAASMGSRLLPAVVGVVR